MNRDSPCLQTLAIARARDHGLHTQSSERVSVFGLHRIARFARLVGEAVCGAHEVADEFRFEHFDFGEPLAGCSADPTGDERTSGEAMMLGQRLCIFPRTVQASFAFRLLLEIPSFGLFHSPST